MGILLLIVLTVAWIQERENIIREKFLRRKMIRLLFRKYDDDYEFTEKNKKDFQNERHSTGYNEARKCPPPQQVGARIPKQAASISPASLKRQEEVLPMAKLEQRRYKRYRKAHE